MNFFDELKAFNGVKLKDVEYVVKTNNLTANFLYNPTMFVLADNAIKIENILKRYVNSGVNISTHFTKCSLDENAITLYAYTTISNGFPALKKDFHITDVKVEINNLDITINLYLVPQIYEYATSVNREKEIKAKLEENFYGNFFVKFNKKDDYIGEEDVIASNLEFQNSIKMFEEKTVFKISNCQHIFNKTDYNLAIDFSKNTENLAECVVCGKIARCEKKTYKRKHTSNGETTMIDRIFYVITINNDNKFLSCSLFPHVNEEKRGEVLEAGQSVVMSGKFETYNGRLNFVAKSLAICDYEKFIPQMKFKTVNEKYHTVFPVEYQDYMQSDLFSMDEEIELKEKNKSFVVFDLETTGLDSKTCEIIEIGAVKIENGKISSTFSTFIKPQTAIPEEITTLTGITNKMVEDSPSINYVLPDFYKFCYGSSLVAHNIAFDYGFLSQIAKKMCYNFDNEQLYTITIARS
ncbi:MAG: 3'-5' exoribonuclease, partial [Clostridia bacterium]|nr:3'-5' exoribonuclease [Clostridia bacterium]